MATTSDSRFFQEIDEVIQGALWGIPMSHLSIIEGYYEIMYQKPLDYKSFGVKNIQELVFNLVKQNKVLLLKNPESYEPYVRSVSVAESKQIGYLKSFVEELLDRSGGEIAFSYFQHFYNCMYMNGWNSRDFALTDLDQLNHFLKDIAMVEVNSSGDLVMKAVNKDFPGQEAVTREIEEILESCPLGIPMSNWSCIERCYQLRHGKSLDYMSFGVTNIQELVFKLGDRAKVALKSTESRDTYVMSLRLAELQHKGKLKFIVEKLLNLYGGEIEFCSFEDCYERRFRMQWDPLEYGVTDVERLCDVLKDIVMVEVNSSGEKVIKAVNKGSSGQAAYNLRKRKMNE